MALKVSKYKFRPPQVTGWWPIIFLWILRMAKLRKCFLCLMPEKEARRENILESGQSFWGNIFFLGRYHKIKYWQLICSVRFVHKGYSHTCTKQGVILLMESIAQLVQLGSIGLGKGDFCFVRLRGHWTVAHHFLGHLINEGSLLKKRTYFLKLCYNTVFHFCGVVTAVRVNCACVYQTLYHEMTSDEVRSAL